MKYKAKYKIRNILAGFFAIAGLILFMPFETSAQTATYNTSGTYNWTCPDGITSVTVEVWGAGGAGGGSTSNASGGSGGGGGGYTTASVSVTPGNTYTVTVGAGGTGSTGNGTAGTASSFITLTANGGGGGETNTGTPGSGGTASGGSTNLTGGNGITGASDGGAGGAGANGGAGGAGGNSGPGGNGTAPGGGGGGGDRQGGSGEIGGDGADGQVIITWPVITIGDNAIAAADICPNSLNETIHSFTLTGQNGGTTLTGLDFTTTGTYAASDVSNFKLYYTSNATFSTANLIATITSPTAAGTQSFPAFSHSIGNETHYFWITIDVPSGVTSGNTIAVNGTADTDLSVANTEIQASPSAASGTQTLLSTTVGAIGDITGDPGTAYVCAGSAGVGNYSVDPVSGATGYNWVLPSGASIATGANTTIITVDYGLAAADGNILVQATDGSCPGAFSDPYAVSVVDDISIIDDPVSQYGCAGSSLTFSVTATGAGITYQWQEDDGSGFSDITNGGVYSGANNMDLVISDVTGLDGNDYRCVVSGTCNSITSASASLSEISSGLSGTKTVGSGGDYTTLKAAFDDINSFGLSGHLYLEVISNTTETAEASLGEWVDCAGNSGYTVTIYPTGGTRTISGDIATSLVTLNGAHKVTIDGRLDMTGTANSLVFSNSNTAGATLEFTNAACNNTLQYATFRGASVSGTNGVVYFGTAGTTGNNNNTLLECDIRDDATEPLYGIYSEGTAGTPNSDNLVSACNIYNFYENGSISRGIFLYTGNTRWSLSGNSLYQTSSRTDGAFYGISIDDSNGGEFMVDENYIGGTAPLCGGSPMTYNYSSFGIMFEGIIVTCNSVGVSMIQNNVIQNIDFNSAVVTSDGSQYVIWTGIDIWAGRIDVIGNTIGDGSTGSINVSIDEDLNGAGGTAWNNGIWHNGEGNVIDNSVGSITFDGTISTQCGFNAIEYVGTMISDQMIAGNTVGHATTANSIQFAAGATPAMTMGGIYFGTDGDFLTTVARNTVANIDNQCSATNSFLVALNNQATAGDQIIKGNDIHDIATASQEIGYYSTASDFPAFAGIRTNNTSAGADLTIDNNHIYNISSTSTTADVSLFGVYCATGTSGTHLINGNKIHSFSTQNTSSGVWQKGLVLESGTATISNNMIRLGVEGINSDNWIIGLETATASSNSVLFNTTYIGGTATGTRNTESFYRSGSGTADVRNNIFVNARTGGSGYHYAYYLSTSSSLTSDNNIYWDGNSGVTAYDGSSAVTTLGAIQSATGGDNNSLVTDPLLVAPTGTGTACDLHIQNTSPAIGAAATGTGITTDIDPQERVSSGPCIGADEYVTAPYGTDVYGIYSPDGINGNVEDVEILSEGGAPGGSGYDVADPDDAFWPDVAISDYQVITASNFSCTGSDFSLTTTDASPDWLLGNGANPSDGTSSPITSAYASTGYKDIIESVKVYNDFININMESPDPGSILGAPTGAGCPTTYTYTSSEAGSPGYIYSWNCQAPGGCETTVADPYASTTDITFVNQTGVDQVFLVTLDIETECCGLLERVERYITVYPGPTMPRIDGGPFSTCTGGSQIVDILSPDPDYSYEWFDAETGGTQLGSGTSFTFTNIPEGLTSYWVQSTNSFGCSSQRTEVVIEGITAPAPSVDYQSTCGDSDVTFYINSPQAGYEYNWYLGSCGGTLLQSGTATSFTYNVTGAETFYVSAIPPGCGEGYCATPSVSYLTPTDPIHWEGDDATEPNNWFVEENWQNGCLPNCGTNVEIPAMLANYPEIGFNLSETAAAKNLDMKDGASLTFADSKAKLDICGDFIHSGDLITNDFGSVAFIGSSAQTYTRNATATGEFHNVKIDNAAATPELVISSGDMIISSKGGITLVNGVISTGANFLVVKNAADNAISGHSKDSYVYGNLRRYVVSGGTTDYDFPVGSASAYHLATLNNNNMTGPSYVDAEFLSSFSNGGSLDPALAVDAGTPYESVATEGIWRIDPDVALSGGSYDIQIYFDDGYGYQLDGTPVNNALSGLVDNQFGVLKRNSGSASAADWTGEGAGDLPPADASGRLVSDGFALRNNITALSEFAIGKANTPLPVELRLFEASCLDDVVQLTWITESETNNDYFTLYRSTDAKAYEMVTRITGQGNSNSTHEYIYADHQMPRGSMYYKLKQTDFDGETSWSEPVFVHCETGLNDYYITPNPFRNEIFIRFSMPTTQVHHIKVTNVLGQTVYEQTIPKGSLNVSIHDLKPFKPGTYFLNISSRFAKDTHKIMKM
jgi:hypothetical protein